MGVCWGSEVLEGAKWIGEDPQGSLGGLLGVWRGSEVLEGLKWIGEDQRGLWGVYCWSAGVRGPGRTQNGLEKTHKILLGVCWGSEVLEGLKWIGEDPQGSIGGLLGV